jgi:chorismate mutase
MPSWNLIASHVEPQISVEMANSVTGERSDTMPILACRRRYHGWDRVPIVCMDDLRILTGDPRLARKYSRHFVA